MFIPLINLLMFLQCIQTQVQWKRVYERRTSFYIVLSSATIKEQTKGIEWIPSVAEMRLQKKQASQKKTNIQLPRKNLFKTRATELLQRIGVIKDGWLKLTFWELLVAFLNILVISKIVLYL